MVLPRYLAWNTLVGTLHYFKTEWHDAMERLGEADWERGRGRGGEDSQNTLLATIGTKIGKLK
jgi:hypothetical protein